MKYDLVLVRFGEITLKGRNRSRFEGMLMEQIRSVLKPFPAIEIEKAYGRVYLKLNGEAYEEVAKRLKDVFGLLSFSPVVRADHDLAAVREAALSLMNGLSPAPLTFKVSAKRAWKQYPHASLEMNHLVGAHILRSTPGLKVDVHEPEIELKVDIQAEGTFIYCIVEKGAGGFPLGMNGKAMLLLSGGIDSPVAGWMALRKGLEIEAVHFHSYPFTSEQAKDKVIALAKRLSYYSGTFKLHLVPFTEVQTKLAQAGEDHLIITLMRRAMLRIAEQLAYQHKAMAIVTGDSLGQVASQTLGSMNVIGRTTMLPILRPLVMMDKQDIINYAEQIGTFETSILPYEDCCTLFVPKKPAIQPNLVKVEKTEAALGETLDRLIDEAVAGTHTLVLKEEALVTNDRLNRTEQTNEKNQAQEDAWF